jgi:DNA-directed RNA polymerase subunit RPC12/RpoP
MASTPYSLQIRSVECERCGAPLAGLPSGGQVTCSYCRSTLLIAGRVTERRQETRIDEPSRLAGLRAQLSALEEQAIIRTPAGLEHFAGMLNNPATRAAGLEGVRQGWEKTRAVVMANPGANPAAEEHLFRLAIFIAERYREVEDHVRARAMLETALGLLADQDLRDMLRCRLARAAALMGDRVAALGWLSDVNPRPIHLEPDIEYRTARALAAHLEGQPQSVLNLIGRQAGELPLPGSLLLSCVRAHALAAVGDTAAACSVIADASLASGKQGARAQWLAFPGASTPLFEESSNEAHATREKQRVRMARSLFALQGALVVLVGGFVFGNCGTPACLAATTCGDDGLYELTMRRLNECDAAKALLGDDIHWAVGLNYSSGEGSKGCKDGCGVDWTMAVAGSKGRGSVTVSSTDWNGGRHLMGELTTSGGRVDLATCKPK